MLHLIKFMAEQGHEVGLVAAPEQRLLAEAQVLGASVYLNEHFVAATSPYHDLMAIRAVLRAVRAARPDIVHCHSTKAALVARLCCALTRTPVIFTAHGWGFAERRAWWSPSVVRWLERWASKVTARIICVSEFDRDLAVRASVARGDQMTVIRNGVPVKLCSHTDGLSARVPHGLEGLKRPLIISVGRLAPPKDLETLIEALANLETGNAIIVGDGPDRRRLDKLALDRGLGGRVRFLGERDDVPQLLRSADVFVLSSRKEGLPLSIMEAMMTGLPVVASRVGGVPELVEDEDTGFLVSPGDPQSLRDALAALLMDEGLRQRLGHRGRERAQREFTLDRMCAATIAIYEQVLEAREGPPARPGA